MKIYLAAPYTHKDKAVVLDRVSRINKKAAALMREGHIVFSPISHSHPIAVENELPTTFEYWRKMNHSFIDWCDTVFVLQLDGWGQSIGVKDEIVYCRNLKKPIAYINE